MKTYCFDIDGTICTNTDGEYLLARPYKNRIKKINKLFETENKIIFYTARGSTTGIDWEEQTISQLKSWGVKYHELYLGKPTADVYVDDKHKDLFNWFN
tara:strand:+ start:3194 stop:3490 length:297 start_codon:yes stop_codon:yes gene_type:complete